MSISKRIAFGAAASWFSRGVTIILGLVLMPVLFRCMPNDQLATWLLLGQSWVALGVFEYGIAIVFTRRFAFVVGKAGGLNVEIKGEAAGEMADLIAVTKRVYFFLTFIIFGITWISGYLYLRHIITLESNFNSTFLAWTILCLGNAINVWSNPWSCLLQGIGYVGWESIIGSIGQIITLVLQITVVLLGYGVLALAAVTCLSGLVQRRLLLILIRRRRPELFAYHGKWNSEIFRDILPTAIRATCTSLAGALLTSTDQLFVGAANDISELPAFRAAFLLAVNSNILATTFSAVSTVFVSQLWQSVKIDELHRLVIRNLRLGLVLFGTAAAFLLTSGKETMDLWLGSGHFIGYPILGTFVFSQALEANTSIISTASRATNDEAFVWSTIISGLLKVSLALVLIRNYGLLGLALSTPLAQLFTNHWFTIYRGLRRLKISFLSYLTKVLLPVLGGTVALYFVLLGLRIAMHDLRSWQALLSALLISGAATVTAIVFFVLSMTERRRFLQSILRLRSI